MRRIWFLPLLLGAVFVMPLSAQGHRPGTVGLGIGIDAVPNSVTSVFGFDADGRTGMILVPIQVATRIRLQPAIGYWRFSQDVQDAVSRFEQTLTQWSAGLALHYLFPLAQKAQTYVGSSIAFNRLSETERTAFSPSPPSRRTAKRTDTVLSAIAGGEYFFAPRFSMGGEVQLQYLMAGDVETSVEPTPTPPPVPVSTPEFDASVIQTNGQFVIRWYFGG
ncbi:MAG: outer membrane beta-barrel protein [Gemmatimonadales bacterium]|nr:outer membrane beta-barrel protein [Gemmatimonadales bacterium]